MINPLFASQADPGGTAALTALDSYAEPQAPMPMMTGLSAFDAYSPQPEPTVTFASEPTTPTVGALFAQGPASPQATTVNTVMQQPSLLRTDVPRTYRPPAPGSFDPYTAAMTGNIPRFFAYNTGPDATSSGGSRGGADTVGGSDGDWTVPAPSTPSPDQSLSGLLNSLRTGLSVATGPLGIATALFSLALSDAARRDPSFNLSTREKLRALADILGLSAPVPNARDTEDTISDLPVANVDTGTPPPAPTPPAPSTLTNSSAVIGTPNTPAPDGALTGLEVSPEAPKAADESGSQPGGGGGAGAGGVATGGALEAFPQTGAGAVDAAPAPASSVDAVTEAVTEAAPEAQVGALDSLSELADTTAPTTTTTEAATETTNAAPEAGKGGSEEGGQKGESGGQKGSAAPGPGPAAAPAAMDSAVANAIAEALAGIGPVGGRAGSGVADAEAAGAAAAAAAGVTSANTADDTDFGGFGGVSAAGMGGFGETGTFGDMGGVGFGGATASANANADPDQGGEAGGGGGAGAGGAGGGGGAGYGDSSEGGNYGGESQFAAGGLVAFANGGLVPLANGGKIAIGPGGGLDDLIPTSINGRRAAALSDGEFVIPADVVSMMGDGSSNAGARRFYDLVKQVRQTKTGTARQAGPLPVGDILKRSLA